jgi:hypothetical protein
LEPSNFSHSCHRTNQAAIPQHVNRPTKQKTQKEDSSNTNNHYTSKFSEFHDVSFLVSIQVLYTQTDLLSSFDGFDTIQESGDTDKIFGVLTIARSTPSMNRVFIGLNHCPNIITKTFFGPKKCPFPRHSTFFD